MLNYSPPAASTRLTAFVVGGVSENDGAGGMFTYDSASVASTNIISYGGPFKPASSGGRWIKLTSGARDAVGGQLEVDSQFVLSGSFGTNNIGDNRAMGIRTLLHPDPTGGTRSAEGINNHFSISLPPSGSIATIEGYHIDFSGAWGPWTNNLWNPTAATIGSVIGFRVRGMITLPTGADYAVGLQIDPAFRGGALANYNIWSQGSTETNRFDGRLHVWGDDRHMIGQYGGGVLPGGPLSYVGLFLGPNVSADGGVYGTRGVHIGGQITPAATRNGYGMVVSPNLIEAGSGIHPDFVSLQVEPPTITAGAGSVNNATTLKITAAPTVGTVQNYSLWVDAGKIRLDDDLELNGGNLAVLIAGKGLRIAEGSNARMGATALVNGTVTVNNTSITANTRVFLTRQVQAGTTSGTPSLGTVVAATSFVINSLTDAAAVSADDDSTIGWLLVEPSP